MVQGLGLGLEQGRIHMSKSRIIRAFSIKKTVFSDGYSNEAGNSIEKLPNIIEGFQRIPPAIPTQMTGDECTIIPNRLFQANGERDWAKISKFSQVLVY